jgi:hypothetical protein
MDASHDPLGLGAEVWLCEDGCLDEVLDLGHFRRHVVLGAGGGGFPESHGGREAQVLGAHVVPLDGVLARGDGQLGGHDEAKGELVRGAGLEDARDGIRGRGVDGHLHAQKDAGSLAAELDDVGAGAGDAEEDDFERVKRHVARGAHECGARDGGTRGVDFGGVVVGEGDCDAGLVAG